MEAAGEAVGDAASRSLFAMAAGRPRSGCDKAQKVHHRGVCSGAYAGHNHPCEAVSMDDKSIGGHHKNVGCASQVYLSYTFMQCARQST